MRNLYLVSYDISDQKRLRNVFKTMRGFGESLHYSVFLCELSLKEKAILIAMLDDIIHHNDDRIVIVNLGRTDGKAKERIEFLGQSTSLPERQAIVV